MPLTFLMTSLHNAINDTWPSSGAWSFMLKETLPLVDIFSLSLLGATSFGYMSRYCVNLSPSLFCVFLQDMHVISTDENQVFAAVQEWNQNDTYNLYISDTRGVYFTLALENVQSSRGPEGNVMIDLYEVCHKAMFVGLPA